MRVPRDVTLLFSDDNWGNIRRLPKLKDSSRAGGYGIYYHFDYVGGPRSYKWINTNPLPKIWQQMNLAYQYHARRIWIVNVGDLKPMEFPISFFLDYAWNPESIKAEDIPAYTRQWAKDQFGSKYAAEIADILTLYGKYNGRRKPELMSADTYSLHHYREFERVTKDYDQLAQKAEEIYNKLPKNYKAAYYQLVLYPVKASANLYDMYFDLAKNRWYAKQGRTATNKMAGEVRRRFKKDAQLANYYNTKMADGKWDHIMDQSNIGYSSWDDPDHDIMPKVDSIQVPKPAEMGVAIEGSAQWWQQTDSSAVLPTFNRVTRNRHYFEVFNRGETPFKYNATSGASWLHISDTNGRVDGQKRLWVSIDWDNVPAGTHKVPITISGTDEKVKIQAIVHNPLKPEKDNINGFVEAHGYISMEAAHFTKAVDSNNMRWQVIPELGRTLSGVSPMPDTVDSLIPDDDSPHLEYNMYLRDAGDITVHTYMSPTLDIHASGGLRFAVSVDDQKPKIVTMNINKNYGSWAQAVSQNIEITKTKLHIDEPGPHTLKFWMVDPGVVLQKIIVDAGGLHPSYLGPPESFHHGSAIK
ncbi:MAG TPA: glycosyl hydrolase 115 family protein, partial [Balneolaceae bacterium]|nr:glycosyl hydrolase 115 family protein [Balneolaceae bacterium]